MTKSASRPPAVAQTLTFQPLDHPLVAVRVEAALALLAVQEPARVARLTGAVGRLSNRRSSRTPLARARN